ncbi:MAG: 3-oxoacyl-[acyl-carrier-protein] reductase [Tistrella sp.]|jgi:3-oxoacyl-[acyl-carrier protein] reductase|uniref:3-oxoacyl-[acyl-carrier-protein] reductase n=2 Tax=Tistrella mobilis TaxID=171437 RepID=I3TLR6_TISMK|nr:MULTISPECIES: 3-oxoacyl-[acyl-carrier-protein] reductase [Tistrella]AFK53704.1 dehydrogenase [Tistrella mobilis KA081020-065]KYO51992.1 beta-ketoacyl-ACP reductase [Tistrella mobilis]MAD39611.1 3-oxoacyl-[acyl-carrier-protein] reductase [Tistrella sp.]MAM77151.1 3-oxoacyl-[acyl-carrier-protein] reductase [Tistrella sp.]MBA74166.1 3-oxoacyl-[acyl-carrier-protein] reductase [Tistrella sp.]
MFDLTQRTALVTGATGGIGAAIARALHAQGAVVALHGRRADALEGLAAELGSRVHVLPADLAADGAAEQLVKDAEAAMGGLDILVSNAGLTRDTLLMRMKDADFDQVIDVNLKAGFRLARAAMKGMMKRRYGRIVAVTSVVGHMGNPGQANYAASKGGLTAMIKAIAHEVASRGITANCVAPGYIATPMTDVLTDEQKTGLLEKVPVGRLGSPEDVAAAIVYLASAEAAYVTGQTLHVNGGMVMI